MASIVLSTLGSSLGNQLLPGLGGRLIGTLGRRAGKLIDADLGLSSSASTEGPKLTNLRVQDSRYGNGLPLVFGQARVAGNYIWASDLIETSHETRTSSGKGGGIVSSLSGTKTTYTYSLHAAIAIAMGEIGGIQTIWADSKVIYQNGAWVSGVLAASTLYAGTDTQEADPFMQSLLGAGQVPAYRGVAYLVLESLQLSNFGNRLPNLTFEVLPKAVQDAPIWLGSVNAKISQQPYALDQMSTPPIILTGASGKARTVLVGGYDKGSSAASFCAVTYDVTGSVPAEKMRAKSESFSLTEVSDHAWARSPDKRFVAFYLRDTDGTRMHWFSLYDTQEQSFGPVFSVACEGVTGSKQLVWLDALHFALPDSQGTKRGLRVFARSGARAVDLGFFDVWGAGSTSSVLPVYITQFTQGEAGTVHYVGDAITPTRMFARLVTWKNGALTVGAQYTLTSGITFGQGTVLQAVFVQTAANEWTFFVTTTLAMIMMSFEPGATGATITRPWQRIYSAVNPVFQASAPVVLGSRLGVVNFGITRGYYSYSEIDLGDGAFSLAKDAWDLTGESVSEMRSDLQLLNVDGSRIFLMAVSGYDHTLSVVGLFRRRRTGEGLDAIVASILARAGYDEADYDVTALADFSVDGYVIEDPMTAASALEPLQVLCPFNLLEREGKMTAVVQNANVDLVLPEGELAVSSKDAPAALTRARTKELDLPAEISIDYLDASLNYETGTQRARRTATRGATERVKISLPLVATASAAKQMAETRLFKSWAERDKAAFALSQRWIGLEVGDVVDLGASGLVRLETVKVAGGLLTVSGSFVPRTAISSSSNAEAGSREGLADLSLATPTLYLMDIPLLRSADDEPGVYVAASGPAPWKGSTLWRAPTDGSFSNVASLAVAATAGVATSVLPSAPSESWDRVSAVTVQLQSGMLSSCTEAELLNGANAALLGGEVIQFASATLVGPGLYQLGTLLRARRGTESGLATHALGEAFVLLTTGSVNFLPATLSDRNVQYSFRCVASGGSLDAAPDCALSYGLKTIQPLAPAHVTGKRASGPGGDVVLSWIRRARSGGEWVDYIDVPLDETSERYDVEILNGASVVRSFLGLTSATATYTAAQQTTDWGSSIPSKLTVCVYQVSDRYGRGQGATASV